MKLNITDKLRRWYESGNLGVSNASKSISEAVVSLLVYRKSIQDIPMKSGFIWVKAKDVSENEVLVWSAHCQNIFECVRMKSKNQWFENQFSNFWVEVLLDEDIALSA